MEPPPRAGQYLTIVSDPPWRYDNASTRGHATTTEKGRWRGHYETMTVKEMKKLPVKDWIAPGAHLYLWTTTNFLRRGFSLMEAWGFEYVTNLVWIKPQMGMGNYFRISHEHVLFGAALPRQRTKRKNQMSWFKAARGEHSAKPEDFYRMVESMSEGPMLDMFSRGRSNQTSLGEGEADWDTWGLEA